MRAIVLKGAGERAFVAGADISEFPSLREAPRENGGSARGIQKLGARMDAAHTPFVAAIHGFCLGGGLELAMCCDIRVASDDAQLGQPEIKLGLIPGGGGTQRLPRLVGLGRALLLNLTGDFIDARTAYEWGLVEKVVPREELLETALGIARTIAARSPVSVAVLRELARTTRDLPLEEAAPRGGRVPPLPRVRGRRRGRRRVPREARAAVHRPGRRKAGDITSVTVPRPSSCHPHGPTVAFAGEAGVLKGTGGPEQLVLEEVPEPVAAEGQAVVDVRACGINFADVLVRLGRYPQMPELPAVLGSEIAGELDGDRVFGFVRGEGGGYAERVVVDRRRLLRSRRERASPRARPSRWRSSPPGSR